MTLLTCDSRFPYATIRHFRSQSWLRLLAGGTKVQGKGGSRDT